MQPKITTTITCVKCGGAVNGGDQEYIVRCPYCGVEYQLSISAVVVAPADVEEKIKTLIACVLGGNPRERDEACLELAKIKDARVVAPVAAAHKELLFRNDDHTLTRPILEILQETIQKMNDPAAVDVLIKELRDEKSTVRSAAAQALEKIGDPSSLDVLIGIAGDPGQDVCWAALDALGAFRDERIPGILISALKDKDYYAKCSALRSLGRQKCRDAMKIIIDILKDTSNTPNYNGVPWSEVRKWAANTLGEIGDDAAVKPLLKAIKDSDDDVRKWARNALAAIWLVTDDDAIKKIIDKALKKPDN